MSNPVPTPLSRRSLLAVTLAAPVLTIAACSSSSSSSTSSTTSSSGSGASSGGSSGGAVAVLYAGSLVDLMTKQIGPDFGKATSYTVQGFSAGSTALASQIKGKVRKADVFISASPAADKVLMGSQNGDWVSWYASFASSALVIGYSTKSKFADDFKTKPWYDVLSMPGIKIGTTDPATDPKGKLAHEALVTEGKTHPALTKLAADSSIQYPEETMLGYLQSGQLDAGFFYTIEAKAAALPTVPITGQDLKATYTVSIIKGAPNQAGAEAFVKYLLGSDAQATLSKDGFTLTTPPKVTGTGVPSSLSGVLPKA